MQSIGAIAKCTIHYTVGTVKLSARRGELLALQFDGSKRPTLVHVRTAHKIEYAGKLSAIVKAVKPPVNFHIVQRVRPEVSE